MASAIVLGVAAGIAFCAACGDEPDSATIDGYWSLSTDEETTIRIDAPEGSGRLVGLSAHDLPVLPEDDGSCTIPGWCWQGAPATARLALSDDGDNLTVTIATRNGPATASPVLTMAFVRATADADVLETRIRDQMTLYAGAAVQEGIHALQVAVQSWMVDHDGEAPPEDEVQPGGAIETYVDNWPENPITLSDMVPGEGPGEYTYERVDGGRGYRFIGHLEDGDFTVP